MDRSKYSPGGRQALPGLPVAQVQEQNHVVTIFLIT